MLPCAGGRGPAFFIDATGGATTRPRSQLHHSPFFAVPNLAPAEVGARRGSAVKSRGHPLASPTWISRKWDPGGGARQGGEYPLALYCWGAGALRWSIRRQAARDLIVSGVHGGIEGSGLRTCACTFGRPHRTNPTHSLPPALCAHGSASSSAAFPRGWAWAHLAPAPRATAGHAEHLLLPSGGG